MTVNGDGSITWLHANRRHIGPDSFTYQVSDGSLTSSPANVEIYHGNGRQSCARPLTTAPRPMRTQGTSPCWATTRTSTQCASPRQW
ncbi:MAG: hypothetical protein KF778_21450 [Rhodocyclaceae bacterium]|nr:hypothetical protein [Rhodocyclaceae bacterium]